MLSGFDKFIHSMTSQEMKKLLSHFEVKVPGLDRYELKNGEGDYDGIEDREKSKGGSYDVE